MRTGRMFVVAAAIGALLVGCSASSIPSPRSSAAAEPEYLFVQEGTGGTFTARDDDYFDLTLTGVEARTVYFADRPATDAGSMTTEDFLASFNWAPTPPNAAVVLRDGDDDADTIAVTIDQPAYDAAAGTLHYRAKALSKVEGTALAAFGTDADTAIPASFDQVALFIDDGGLAACGLAGVGPDTFLKLEDGSEQLVASATLDQLFRTSGSMNSFAATSLASLSQENVAGAIELRTAARGITVSPETCIMTPQGPVPAADLEPGARILTGSGTDVVVAATLVTDPLSVTVFTASGGSGPAAWKVFPANDIQVFAATPAS